MIPTNRFSAFLLGMWEFRRCYTWAAPDDVLEESYDRGRELAHWLTRRRFES